MGHLLGAYIFGSIARGDSDARSDLDILAIVADGQGKVLEESVLQYIPCKFRNMEASISWYGKRRLTEMFRNGELFAWHLYQESDPLFERETVISALGRPSSYTGALEDVASFYKVLSEIPGNLESSPKNAVYELGLIYVCLRNICMAASSMLCSYPDLSRYSPFALEGFLPAPLTKSDYEIAMACRMAGQRGISPPSEVTTTAVLEIFERLAPWIEGLMHRLESKNARIN